MYPGAHDPDRAAVVMAGSGETVSYGELEERSLRLARLWHEAGLRPGDHVAILLENHPRYFEVVWAALRSGLYYTPVNCHLTAEEVAFIVGDCGARSLVTSAALTDQAVASAIVDVPLMMDGAADGWLGYEEALDRQPATPLDEQPNGQGMFYSSGTTGRPKGILFPLPDRSVTDDDPMVLNGGPLGLADGCVYLLPSPLYHASPVVTGALCHRYGGTVVVMETFDAAACLDAIERYQVDVAQFVPTMFVRMLKLPDDVRTRADLSSLRHVSHAAAPCPVDVKRQMIEWWGPIIVEFYAGSENVGSTLITSAEWLDHPGSVGLPRFCTTHICDDDFNDLPTGEIGTVWFDTPGAAMEYHGDPEKTAENRSPQGWYTMGDVGYLDDDGYLYLTDRKTFMIVSGGVNVYPQEAENVLIAHDAVLDVAVIGVPDDDLGEVAKAVVQLVDPAAGTDALAAELLTYCSERLARYKCPRSVDFIDALPRLDTGKLYKRLLRDRYWGDRTSRIV
ncbi:MAG: putative acyl-CoA ligase [Acidimicrobiales bacterium]|nr:MAG: putative acyl-CoA ligase [Acidimicrobiales bacterium]